MNYNFTNCPFCNDILVSQYFDTMYDKDCLRKICMKKLDHQFVFVKKFEQDPDIVSIVFEQVKFTWVLTEKSILICNRKKINPTLEDRSSIPFFMPDFSDCAKLLKKLKTYILIS